MTARKLLLTVILPLTILGLLCEFAHAGNGIVSIGEVKGCYRHDTLRTDAPSLSMMVHFTNNTGYKIDLSTGFRVLSPDGAIWDSVTLKGLGPACDSGYQQFGTPFSEACWFFSLFPLAVGGEYRDMTPIPSGPDTVGFLGVGRPNKPDQQMPVGFDDSVATLTVWLGAREANAGKQVCVDSSFWGVGGTWIWVSYYGMMEFHPDFVNTFSAREHVDGQGYCFAIVSAAEFNDWDVDAAIDVFDNCPHTFNPTQLDSDNDGNGDLCDPFPYDAADDADHDGFGANVDNCPNLTNPGQEDADNNGIGDMCCCLGLAGDLNFTGTVDLADLSRAISYVLGNTAAIGCPDQANIDRKWPVDLKDLSAMIAYLLGSGTPPPQCP